MIYQHAYDKSRFLHRHMILCEELLETIQIPEGKPLTFAAFLQWAQKQPVKVARDPNKLLEVLRTFLAHSDHNNHKLVFF